MENLKIKHKQFEVLEILSKDSYKALFKGQTYLIKKYDPESSEFSMLKKIIKTNISIPKIKIFDKKTGYVVSYFVEGELVSDYILNNDFNENIYDEIFKNSYMARAAGLNLDYSLNKWLLSDNKLFYVDTYCEKYDYRNDFTKSKIREWFLTTELYDFYKNIGVLFDKKRIKNEFLINKEMVLMTCKYYR